GARGDLAAGRRRDAYRLRGPGSVGERLGAAGELRGEDFDGLDPRRLGEEVLRLRHERRRDGAIEVRLAARVVGERVEDAERRGAELDCEPRDGAALLIGQCETAFEELLDFALLAGLGFEPDEKTHAHHGRPPYGQPIFSTYDP